MKIQNLLKNLNSSIAIRKVSYNPIRKIPVAEKRGIFSIFEFIFRKSNKNKISIFENIEAEFGCERKLRLNKVPKRNSYIIRKNINNGACIALTEDFKTYNLADGPSCYSFVTKKEAQHYYKQMQIIRLVERVANAMLKQKIIPRFCHLYRGQEACATGIKAAMSERDHVITSNRCHGWSYLMGLTPYEILAELTGHGRGGSRSMYGRHFHSSNGVSGSQVSIGSGVALFCKYNTPGVVSIITYGDDAAIHDNIYETFHIASLWKLPCVFVCENNKYGMINTPKRFSLKTDYYKSGNALPAVCVNGRNVLAVKNAASFAIRHVLKHSSPMILELDTYCLNDKIKNLPKLQDPIIAFKTLCAKNNLITSRELKQIDYEVRQEVQAAVKKTKIDIAVPVEEVTTNVYVKCLEPKIRSTIGYTLSHKVTSQRAEELEGEQSTFASNCNKEKPISRKTIKFKDKKEFKRYQAKIKYDINKIKSRMPKSNFNKRKLLEIISSSWRGISKNNAVNLNC